MGINRISMKRSLNDFGGFDSKPAEKKWRFRLKTTQTWMWRGVAADWYAARQVASCVLNCDASQLIGEPDTK